MDSPIFRFRHVDELLATAAQPTADQISWLAAHGFEAVVNLSTPTARNFVPDEARLVMDAGRLPRGSRPREADGDPACVESAARGC